MRLSTIALLAAVAMTSPVLSQDAAKPAPPASQAAATAVTDPQQFAVKAAVSNMFEIESSNVALQKASSEDVKAFAQQMISDHTKAGEEMKAATDAQGVATPTALDADHQGKLDQLNGLSGDEFDGEYLTIQLAAHKDAVELFDSYSKGGAEGQLRAFAQKTLPTLQSHFEEVNKLAGSSAGKTSSNAADDVVPAPENSTTPTDANAGVADTSASTDAAVAPTSILASGYTVSDKDNLATEIIGKQVYSSEAADAEHIGDVNNLVVGDNGQIAAVVIGVGGFLGIGEKNVAVNYSELQWVVAEDNTERFILPTSKDALQAAPDFKTTDDAARAN